MSQRVYMDYQATTPVDRRVLEAMLPYFGEHFGNPSSKTHAFGWSADSAVEEGRERVARLLNAKPAEIVFTSGATEANHLALLGVLDALGGKSLHVVTQATEHKAILDQKALIHRRGGEMTIVPVNSEGTVDVGQIEAALRPTTALVSIMMANNEIGTLQPLRDIVDLCKRRGILVHTDAAQAAGRIPIDVTELGVDLLSLSAHKFYGPKGVGALFVRKGAPGSASPIFAQQVGGGHERGRRSGTLNVPGIVGMGAAAELVQNELSVVRPRLEALSARLFGAIASELEGVHLNGPREGRLPGNLSLAFEGIEAETLMLALPDLALSPGSACNSATLSPSHVLMAIGLPPHLARATVRFGLGAPTTAQEVELVAKRVVEQVSLLRKRHPRPHTGGQELAC